MPPAEPGMDFEFIAELDEEQREAVMTVDDAVVSAGAGSGKTRVLTARYGWLIMTGRCKVEEILAITFTNKAANEMYRRIYTLLSRHAPSNEYARKAVDTFHAARISTLDHFCAVVTRTLCRRFGVSPDFESSEVKVRELARSLALRFVLDKRNNPALEHLMAETKMRAAAEELFVNPVLYHSSLSRPLDCSAFEKIQREEILSRWKALGRKTDEHVAVIGKTYNAIPLGPFHEHLHTVLSRTRTAPHIENILPGEHSGRLREGIVSYLDFLAELTGFRYTAGRNGAVQCIHEELTAVKETYELLLALAHYALQWDVVTAVFPLLDEYQKLLNEKKRAMGLLTFTDIAHMAVDGLARYPDIRQMYRNSLKMIMIDEFQDNNSLQRELVDLLLEPARVFYVGDEKQSIYRFRGADVSVFRDLQKRQTGVSLYLGRNYRSHPDLIRSFNRLFGGYRQEDDTDPVMGIFPAGEEAAKNYEAVYRPAKSGKPEAPSLAENTGGNVQEMSRLHFAFLDEGRVDRNDSLKPEDHEALYIAQKIRELVDKKTPLEGREARDAGRPCSYGDCAVLQRSYARQHALERAFKLFDIPFNADRPAALFDDAPVNDLWAFLKLLVYPDNRIAYGALLRSPLVRLSEDAFTLCMFRGGEPFNERLDEELPPPDRRRYREGRLLYRNFRAAARDRGPGALLTMLWYEEGYRHEALWSARFQPYLDLYDLFFEQARTIEEQGGGLVDFLDYLDDLAHHEEKYDDAVLPGEEGGVRIMTIHRSKGLEFPVVFLYGCGVREKTVLDRGLAFFTERWGLSLKLPPAEELPEGGGYFYLAEQTEHRSKTEAELRRLLYVAMTRAEQLLYVTAVIPAQNQDEREALNEELMGGYGREFITERFEQFRTSTRQSLSFLRLFPSLQSGSQFYTLDVIHSYPEVFWHKQAKQGRNAEHLSTEAAAARKAYNAIPCIPPYRFVPQTAAASSIHGTSQKTGPGVMPSARYNQGELDFDAGEIDNALAVSGLSSRDFGVIVHSFIEDRFNNRPPQIPRRFSGGNETQRSALFAAALSMTEGFFDSPLGRRAAAALFRRTEYPILTTIQRGERKILVSGTIDLLFDDGDTVYVVDFKTDRDEDLTRHAGQLAVYRQAAADIFGKPVQCRLFYLRTRDEADLSGAADVSGISFEM